MNRYIIVPFVVWAVAQFLKFTIAAFKGNVSPKFLYGSGGMPSVHSAVVTSLATTALLMDGVGSAIFGFSTVFAAIVMYDSFGIRRSSGEQAVAINAILSSLEHDRPVHPDLPHHRLRELLGHKPLEVTMGALLGVFLGGLFNYDKLDRLIDVITTTATNPVIYALAAISIVILICGLYLRLFWLRPYRELEPVHKIIVWGSWSAWLWALVGLALAGLQYENVQIAIWDLWPGLWAVLVILTTILIARKWSSDIPSAVKSVAIAAEKEKWMEGPNKKRRAKAARAKKRK